MRIFLSFIIAILFFPLNVLSQTQYTGIIISSENGSPIEGVIVRYGDTQNDYIVSDKNGKFTIPEKHNEILNIQVIGYISKSILSSRLQINNIISLELSPIELNPIEITPIDANNILSKSIYNIKNNLLTGTYMEYLLHFKQKEEYSGEEQEISMKYAALLEKNKPNDKKLSYSLRKIELEKIKSLPEKPTSTTLKKNIFNVGYHLKELDSYYIMDNYKVTIADSPGDLIILSAIPKEKNKKDYVNYKFYINKADTTLVSISIDTDYKNSEDGYKNFGTRKYKISKTNTYIHFSVHFSRKGEKYYQAECLQILEILLVYKDGTKEKIISYSNSKVTDINYKVPANIEKLQKLDGYSKQLF